MAAFRCSVASTARDEPVAGTASGVTRWLLVEQESPWGPSSFPDSSLGPALTAAVQRQARALAARALLVRRTSTGLPGNFPARRVWLVDSRPGDERVLTRLVTDEAELADLPLREGWTRSDAPLFLVCAHGRHDTCCAVEGRPLAKALAEVAPEETWTCSHVGGDRFAPNVVVLPSGLFYSRVPAAAAATLVAAVRAGLVIEEWVRGRAGLSPAGQVAQHHARLTLGRYGVAELLPLREEPAGSARVRVALDAGAGSEVTVLLRRGSSPDPHLLTCHAALPHRVPTWELVDLQQ